MIFGQHNSYSVCITCCDRDVFLLDFALEVISLQTIPFSELIISANGLPKSYFDDKPKQIFVKGKQIPISYYTYPTAQTPGFARNFGARFCTTEYIMFCDIDDVSLDHRLEIAKKTIETYDLDIFLNGQGISYEHTGKIDKDYLKALSGNCSEEFMESCLINNQHAFSNPALFMKTIKKSPIICMELARNKFKIWNKQAKGNMKGANTGALVWASWGHLVIKVSTLMSNKYDETLKLGEDIELIHRLCVNKNIKIGYNPTPMVIHREQLKLNNTYDYLKQEGKWEIDDNFRKKYLKNKLDKNQEVTHNWDYERKESEI